jgi:hypothetical protein
MQAMEERSSAGQKLSLRRRLWRRLTKRVTLLVYQPGDTVGDVAKRVSVFVLGWGGFIALLTWAGYRHGDFHSVGDGIVFACGLFLLAVLVAPGYRGLGPPRPQRR